MSGLHYSLNLIKRPGNMREPGQNFNGISSKLKGSTPQVPASSYVSKPFEPNFDKNNAAAIERYRNGINEVAETRPERLLEGSKEFTTNRDVLRRESWNGFVSSDINEQITKNKGTKTEVGKGFSSPIVTRSFELAPNSVSGKLVVGGTVVAGSARFFPVVATIETGLQIGFPSGKYIYEQAAVRHSVVNNLLDNPIVYPALKSGNPLEMLPVALAAKALLNLINPGKVTDTKGGLIDLQKEQPGIEGQTGKVPGARYNVHQYLYYKDGTVGDVGTILTNGLGPVSCSIVEADGIIWFLASDATGYTFHGSAYSWNKTVRLVVERADSTSIADDTAQDPNSRAFTPAITIDNSTTYVVNNNTTNNYNSYPPPRPIASAVNQEKAIQSVANAGSNIKIVTGSDVNPNNHNAVDIYIKNKDTGEKELAQIVPITPQYLLDSPVNQNPNYSNNGQDNIARAASGKNTGILPIPSPEVANKIYSDSFGTPSNLYPPNPNTEPKLEPTIQQVNDPAWGTAPNASDHPGIKLGDKIYTFPDATGQSTMPGYNWKTGEFTQSTSPNIDLSNKLVTGLDPKNPPDPIINPETKTDYFPQITEEQKKQTALLGSLATIPIAITLLQDSINTNTNQLNQIPTQINNAIGNMPQPTPCQWPADRGVVTGGIANNLEATTVVSGKQDATNTTLGLTNATLGGIANTQLVNLQSSVNTVSTTLGTTELAGGITGFIQSSWTKFINNDLVNKALLFYCAVCNTIEVFQLTNSAADMVKQGMMNILELIPFVDANGVAAQIGDKINSTVENLFKAVMGAEAYSDAKRNVEALSKVISTAGSLFNSIQACRDDVLDAMYAGNENMVSMAENLQENGLLNPEIVWSKEVDLRMAKTKKYEKLRTKIAKIYDGGDSFEGVTSKVVSAKDDLKDVAEAGGEFTKSLKDGKKELLTDTAKTMANSEVND